MTASFRAFLDGGDAVLCFPYDDRLRWLMRAIPGRGWDPESRAWRVPLDPDRAASLALLMEGLPAEPEVSRDLQSTLSELRERRDARTCRLDTVRRDENLWLSFPTDCAPAVVETLLGHSRSVSSAVLGRGYLPLDAETSELLAGLRDLRELELSPAATRALRDTIEGRSPTPRGPRNPAGHPFAHRVEMRHDGRGGPQVVIAPEHAELARSLARTVGLELDNGRRGSVTVPATERKAPRIKLLIARLGCSDVDERITRWLERWGTWRGIIDVDGDPGQPLFLLLGESALLPDEIRMNSTSAPGGVSLPLTLASWRLIASALTPQERPGVGGLTERAWRCVRALREGRLAPPAVLELSQSHEEPTFVLAQGHDCSQQRAFAELPGALGASAKAGGGSGHEQAPTIRADPFCVPALDHFLAENEIWVESDALSVLQEIREQHAHAAGIVALSAASDAALDIPYLGGKLKPFQRAGVKYLLAQRRALLADEQGLGKTVEALAAIEAESAYPAVVVCPASLKLNWMREIARWLPHRSAQKLSGTGSGPVMPSAITVVNYDVLATRVDALRALAPRSLVLDESHYCKSPKAKRSQAAHTLATAIPKDGLVFALTGTPVMNRTTDLVSQLRILGRLEDFGSGVKFGKRFRGGDAHVLLHWHLRARCFVRRLKTDVLPQLPAKTRAIVPVELDNESEYRLAQEDVIEWLRTQPLELRELDARVAAALRAERLVRLNALRRLAAKGKLHAALAWVHDFLSSGEPLVLFAHHVEIQRAVLERFPTALHVLGQDSPSARDAAVRAFQESTGKRNQLILCSLEVAGQGITLTRSSNVAFLELDWTPAKLDQAEDRCHRIGQESAVNATYLLAADTVDEQIASLLERKRLVIAAVTDGEEGDEQNVVDALARSLRETPYRHLRAVA